MPGKGFSVARALTRQQVGPAATPLLRPSPRIGVRDKKVLDGHPVPHLGLPPKEGGSMRTSLVAGFLALSLAGGGIALAQSRCDSGISKAAGRKVKCKMDVVARAQLRGVTPDAVKLAKCEHRFETA